MTLLSDFFDDLKFLLCQIFVYLANFRLMSYLILELKRVLCIKYLFGKIKINIFIVNNKWFKCINVPSCSDPPPSSPPVETMWKRFKVVKNTKVLSVFYYNHGEYNILRKRVVQWVKTLQNHKVKNSKNW